MKINTTQKINMLAIEVLEQFGFNTPTQKQIDVVEMQLQSLQMAKSKSCDSRISSMSSTMTAY